MCEEWFLYFYTAISVRAIWMLHLSKIKLTHLMVIMVDLIINMLFIKKVLLIINDDLPVGSSASEEGI